MVYLVEEVVKTSCSQRKLIDWQTKNKSSGNEDSHSESDEENLPVFDWIINVKLLKEVAICKHCENALILTEKASQHPGLTTELDFKCVNDKCKLHHSKGFSTSAKSRGVYDIN